MDNLTTWWKNRNKPSSTMCQASSSDDGPTPIYFIYCHSNIVPGSYIQLSNKQCLIRPCDRERKYVQKQRTDALDFTKFAAAANTAANAAATAASAGQNWCFDYQCALLLWDLRRQQSEFRDKCVDARNSETPLNFKAHRNVGERIIDQTIEIPFHQKGIYGIYKFDGKDCDPFRAIRTSLMTGNRNTDRCAAESEFGLSYSDKKQMYTTTNGEIPRLSDLLKLHNGIFLLVSCRITQTAYHDDDADNDDDDDTASVGSFPEETMDAPIQRNQVAIDAQTERDRRLTALARSGYFRRGGKKCKRVRSKKQKQNEKTMKSRRKCRR
jgi:hypothetical protein